MFNIIIQQKELKKKTNLELSFVTLVFKKKIVFSFCIFFLFLYIKKKSFELYCLARDNDPERLSDIQIHCDVNKIIRVSKNHPI